MSNTLPVNEVLETLAVQPVDRMNASNNNFVTGAVSDGVETFFLKVVKEGMDVKVNNDLGNEVAWNNYAGPYLAEKNVRVPEVLKADSENRYVLFEYLEGKQAGETDLQPLINQAAQLAADICDVPLGREGEDLSEWYMKRLDTFRNVLDIRSFNDFDRKQFSSILDGAVDLSVLKAGMIHGDLIPKNLIISRFPGIGLGLPDAEFGTRPDKPEYDKPRYNDIAKYYHLMLVQYRNLPIGEAYLRQSQRNLSNMPDYNEETFDQELHLSVLERTVSMAHHFVTNRDPNKAIDDARRTRPEFYVVLIKSALEKTFS